MFSGQLPLEKGEEFPFLLPAQLLTTLFPLVPRRAPPLLAFSLAHFAPIPIDIEIDLAASGGGGKPASSWKFESAEVTSPLLPPRVDLTTDYFGKWRTVYTSDRVN